MTENLFNNKDSLINISKTETEKLFEIYRNSKDNLIRDELIKRHLYMP